MAGNNFKESLKSQFRDAFGEQPRHLATRPAPEVIRPGEEEPHRDMAKGLGEDSTEVKPAPSETMSGTAPRAEAVSTASPKAEEHVSEILAVHPKEPEGGSCEKRVAEHRCDIEDFLRASPEEQLCYSLGEQMTAILKHLLSMPKPWINLTNATIINESGTRVPTESVRTLFRILQDKGFILSRRRADIGTYRGVAYVLNPKLCEIFCSMHGIGMPEWIFDKAPAIGQGKATARKAGRSRTSDAKYEELARQNEELRRQLALLQEHLARLTENNAG